MARRRLRAAARKHEDVEARDIAQGVYITARELGDKREMPMVHLAFPRPVSAALIYVCELSAVVICQKRGWDRSRADEVAQYVLAGLQEILVKMVQSLDEEHFEAWTAAANARLGV